MNTRRLKQVIKYGWLDSIEIAKGGGIHSFIVFVDILYCFLKYNLWSNQYRKENFYHLGMKERNIVGNKYRDKNRSREKWLKEFFNNYKFLYKWSSLKYETSPKLQAKRIEAYKKQYNMGYGCHVGHDVLIMRHHYLDGNIKIGNKVLLAKHVFIDFSGSVLIKDGVKIADGVIIESHYRDIDALIKNKKDVNIPTQLIINENAYIGSRAIILASCSYIGKNARIGAGAVVTKDVPDNTVVAGVPGKVVRIIE